MRNIIWNGLAPLFIMMNQERRKLLISVFGGAWAISLALTGAIAEAADDAKLLFLGNRNIAPVVYLDNTTPAGVAVDIVRAIAKHMPQLVEIRAMDWPEAQALVARGEADALIQINATEERKKIYDFSEPLLESQFSIFTTTNRVGISGVSSLSGLRAGVESGGLPRQVLEKNPLIQLTIIPNFLEGFKLLREGAIDVVVVDYRVGSYIIAENKLRNIKVTGRPVAFSYSSIAVKKGNTKLLAAINNALEIIKADGTYEKILDKWKPKEAVFQTREQIAQKVYSLAVLVLLTLFLIAAIWTLTLKRVLAKRKNAEARLKEQYSTLFSIINSANALIFSVDRHYCYTSFNQGHAAAMKALYDREIDLGHSILEYMTVPEDRETARRNYDRAIAGEQFTVEAYSGEELRSRQYFQVSHSPIKSEDEVIGVAVLAQDMTGRKRAEERVAESEARYRALFEDSPISLWEEDFSGVRRHVDELRKTGITDFRAYFEQYPEEVVRCANATKIIAVNQSTLKLFKADSEQRFLEGLNTIFTTESFDVFREELITLANGGTLFQSEAIQKNLAGEKFDTVVRLSIAPGYENTWERVFVSISDITDRKRSEAEIVRLNRELEKRVETRTNDLEAKRNELEESQRALMNIVEDLNLKTTELEEANSKLLELDRLKSMFIASMSHELRTPLNSIIGFSSIIRDGWLGPVNTEQQENLDTIQRSGKHLLSLINDVIDVSKIEAGKIDVQFEEFDLFELMMEAVQYVEKDIREKGLELTRQIRHRLIRTDKRRLLQCIINLLSNAAKFTEKGEITVSAAVAGIEPDKGEEGVASGGDGTVTISVSDTGIGITEKDITMIFKPFVRLESPLKTTVPGTGLGLYLTRKLVVEVLRGDIVCKSEAGKGSTFSLRIPERIDEKGTGSRG